MLKFVTSHHHLLRTRYCYSTVANNKFRVLFFGQDKFATTQLKALVNEQENDSCIKSIDVVYPPDVKINENQVVEKKSSDLKALVESKNLKILRTPPNVNDLDNWEIPNYDVGISVYSFEYPIPSSITNRFKHGTLNVHPSLLPAYRGPSPIEHTIMHGDHQTGVTIETNKHDILAQKSVDLSQSPPVYSDLEQHLAELGSQLLIDTLRQLPNVKPFKSDGTPSEAPKVHKEWAEMDFPNMSAWQAEQLGRAFKYPLTTVYGTQSKEHKDIVVHLLGLYLPKEGPGSVGGGAPGAFVYDDKSQALHIVFGDDSVVACDRIKVDDEQVMSAKEFANKFHTEGKFGTSLGVDDSVVEDNMKRRESMKPYKQ